jgi:hypothetical protein
MIEELLVEPVRDRRAVLTPLEKAVLLTVHYRDLFCHPLTLEELRRYLVLRPVDADTIDAAVETLLPTHLSRVGDYITWNGRESVVHDRRARLMASARLWTRVRRYTGVLRRIPFVRMAAVSGSLAMNHASEDRDDIDLFCIAQPNRVWVVMLWLKLLSLYSMRVDGGAYLCPNTCLAEDQLEIPAQNLYMAHQMVHVVPLWGEDVYAEFLRRNAWVARFLPNAYAEQLSQPAGAGNHSPSRWSERLLPNGIGDSLNTCICRAGIRKAARFYRATHTDEMLRQARNPQRYMLPGLGYTGTVFRRFMEGHASRFAGILSRADMQAAFGCRDEPFVDARLDRGFCWKYEHRDD